MYDIDIRNGGIFYMFKVIVAGSREFNNYTLLSEKLKIFRENVWKHDIADDIVIVSGHCPRGADKLGEKWATNNQVSLLTFPADWDKYGKRAGIIRNEEMGDIADGLIAFWNGKSRGTKHMINYSKKKGIPVQVVMF